ncbi:bifunctional glutamate N-acetyltransferase/amino-acid acetyltransferase ArgJ [Treponema sp. C6A8]|uniref:bifunctional glutamate N-acetyltransferase/amino-acid acetyltransferase ArgJ n=1 Tax=Treponema sp. C6A8 TaxID=1410609 RepID=UPI00056EB8F5|nr:bifunctional glutamate N-acetyltransferase/amino-acid acetyltransferase ArgJ [Treponema sp. C6A8]
MSEIKFIEGGVTAAKGFTANGILCHIKASRKTNDTALVVSEVPCSAAGVFTQNRVKAESVKLSKKNIANGRIQAIIANSGNANCCTGEQGAQNALRMAKAVEKVTGVAADDVIVCSTGVIGAQLPVEKIEENIDALAKGLSKEGHKEARIAIMTTDTKYKECAVEFPVGGKVCHMGTMCKGSGMIHINLGTMLSFITTDCAISPAMIEKALRESIKGTYNCVSVDGDTSTNDTLVLLANGMAGNAEITAEGADYEAFLAALNKLNRVMAMKIAADGEGATRLVQCTVNGASSVEAARGLAKEVISSSLVKAAMFGADANFGRFLCAMGYSGIEFDPMKTNIWFTSKSGAKRYFEDNDNFEVHGENSVKVYENGVPLSFDEDLAKQIMSEEAVEILVQCGDGNASGTAWGCDLTYDYVKINGDYRT